LPNETPASSASLWFDSFVAAPSRKFTFTSVGGSLKDWRIATIVAGLPAISRPEKLDAPVTAWWRPVATSTR
jgi:hypothetical protein